jgi:hypothetical protein
MLCEQIVRQYVLSRGRVVVVVVVPSLSSPCRLFGDVAGVSGSRLGVHGGRSSSSSSPFRCFRDSCDRFFFVVLSSWYMIVEPLHHSPIGANTGSMSGRQRISPLRNFWGGRRWSKWGLSPTSDPISLPFTHRMYVNDRERLLRPYVWILAF